MEDNKGLGRVEWYTHKVRMPYAPAIEAMQDIVSLANDTISDPTYVIAAGMALDALKREAMEDVNDPLTLEELRGMDGEPVYLVAKHMTSRWDIVRVDYDHDYPIVYFRNTTNGRLQANGYGKTWLAYRRKPEEGEQG